MSAEEEFTKVAYKKKSRKSKGLNKTVLNSLSLEDNNCISKEKSLTRILGSKEEILHSQFYSNFKTLINEVISITNISEIKRIICLGLGPIGDNRTSQYQIGLLLNICDDFNIRNSLVHDPIFSDIECQILEQLGLHVDLVNKEGKYEIDDTESTLVFTPHCPKQLLNNFLWKNWGKQLSSCIIIGNSFSKIVEANSKRNLQEQAEHILDIHPHVKEYEIDNNFKFNDIFNDTAVHIFLKDKIDSLVSSFWLQKKEPSYSVDGLKMMAANAAKLSTLRGILHELRQVSSDKKLSNSVMARYILDQYRKFKTTEQQWCTAEGEMNYLANTYLCYLKSQRKSEEILSFYKAKGERTVQETAQMVGFKLPHDPK